MNSFKKACFFLCAFLATAPISGHAYHLPLGKKEPPPVQDVFKEKSRARATEDRDVIVNAEWFGEKGYAFRTLMLTNAPAFVVRKAVRDYDAYPKMSSAIKSWKYDAKKKRIEMVAEAAGYRMKSLIAISERGENLTAFKIIEGDLKGFESEIFLWQNGSKTLLAYVGEHAGAKELFPSGLQWVAIPVSEMILGIASKNFRSYIEEKKP